MQEGSFTDVNTLGRKLSLVIGCPVTWPGFNKNVFVCHHGVTFPIFRLKGSSDWSWAKERHDKEVGGQ